jgi:NitT/TauT family transport system substrate-binding protein
MIPLVFVVILLAPAGASALDKFTVIHSSISGSQAVLFVTRDARIFEKHGLDVEIKFIAGGPIAINALLAGEAQAAVMAGPATVTATLGGADALAIMALVNTMDHLAFAQKTIRAPADLKGKKIAISRFNSADDFAIRFALRKWGLSPERDVTILQIGEQPQRLIALRAGTMDATLIQPPLTAVARKEGFTELAALADLGLEYLQTAVTTTKSVIKTREDQLRRFVRAFVEGIHFYKTNKEASLASIGKFMKLTVAEAIEEAYRTYALKFTSRLPYPTAKGVQTILDDLATRDQRAQGVKPEQFIEPRFLKELEDAGIVERLYKGS